MNLKFACLSLAAVASTTALSGAPAQALSLNGQLSFGGSVRVTSSDQNDFLYDFLNGNSSDPGTAGNLNLDKITSTGSFADVTGNPARIKDLATNVNESGFLAPQVTSFISGIQLDSGKILSFTLDSVSAEAVVIGSSSNRSFNLADLSGFFTDGSGKQVGLGSLSAQFKSSDGTGFSTFSGRLEASEVPTPALLPGLVGIGVAALRKRGSSEEETVEA